MKKLFTVKMCIRDRSSSSGIVRTVCPFCRQQRSEKKKYPDLYGDVYHKVRINYYPPRKDNKEAWDNIDIFGWMAVKPGQLVHVRNEAGICAGEGEFHVLFLVAEEQQMKVPVPAPVQFLSLIHIYSVASGSPA